MRGSGIQLTLGIGGDTAAPGARRALAPGAVVLTGFALADEALLLSDLAVVTSAAPFRHLETPGGLRMSVGMTNCGARGSCSAATSAQIARSACRSFTATSSCGAGLRACGSMASLRSGTAGTRRWAPAAST